MSKQAGTVLFVLVMIALVVGVDVLFFRHHTGQRLVANIVIVVVAGVVFVRYVKPG